MKRPNIPFKEKQRHYDYQYNQTDKQANLAMEKEEKQLRKLKEKALKEVTQFDVEEVKHGYWEDMSDKYDKGKDLRCSLCHRRASSFVGGSEDWWDMWEPDYCPHCGAKMDVRSDT